MAIILNEKIGDIPKIIKGDDIENLNNDIVKEDKKDANKDNDDKNNQ